MKRYVTLLLAAALLGTLCLAGCGNKESGEAEEMKQDTAEKTLEETVQPDGESGSQAIMVVSFGTSYNDSREATIGAIEKAIAGGFPEYEVRRAFTSQIIIDKLKERDGLEIDNVGEALDRAVEDGVRTLVVQPTHLMDGYEYMDLADELAEYEDKFDQVVLAKPLLAEDEDYDAVAAAITEATATYDDGETAICFMGHGTEADSNVVYPALQEKLAEAGYENYYIGTVEAEPALEDVLNAVNARSTYKKVVLRPLMVVAGDHANNDMAGDEEDSWKSAFEGAGYEVECILEGLGQVPAIQDIYVAHTQAAVDSLAE